MQEIKSVSSGQLFAMLFVSRMVVSMTYGTLLIGDSELWDHLVSIPIAFILTFLLMVPIYKLFKMDMKMSLIDNSEQYFGKFGILVTALYVIYYLIISFHTLAIFNNFILNAVNPSISLPLLSALLLFSACYGAYKGLEALVRTSAFILLATILAFLFLGIFLLSGISLSLTSSSYQIRNILQKSVKDFGASGGQIMIINSQNNHPEKIFTIGQYSFKPFNPEHKKECFTKPLFYKGKIHEQTLIGERVQTNRRVSNVFMGIYCTIFAVFYLIARLEEKRARKAFDPDTQEE